MRRYNRRETTKSIAYVCYSNITFAQTGLLLTPAIRTTYEDQKHTKMPSYQIFATKNLRISKLFRTFAIGITYHIFYINKTYINYMIT